MFGFYILLPVKTHYELQVSYVLVGVLCIFWLFKMCFWLCLVILSQCCVFLKLIQLVTRIHHIYILLGNFSLTVAFILK